MVLALVLLLEIPKLSIFSVQKPYQKEIEIWKRQLKMMKVDIEG